MAPASYAVWVLILQISAYAGYLNFGLQTAVGRYVAYANELGDKDQRDSVFSTALVGLCGAAAIYLLSLAGIIAAVQVVFPTVPTALVAPMRLALILVGVSMAVDLPASACNGVFVGMARYELPALTTGVGRLAAAVGISLMAIAGQSFLAMAATLAVTNVLSNVAQIMILRRVAPDVRFSGTLVRRSTARELYAYCVGLTVMAFSGLLVSGFDLILVGHFDFSVVVPYSISASIVALIAGALVAVIGVILPHAAALHARQKAEEMGKLVVSMTQLSLLILVLTGIPVIVFAAPILKAMAGARLAESGTPLLAMLLIANMIRLIGAPYSTILIAAGQQSYIKISPLSEGVSNFLASVVLGYFLGGIGVAIGTLIGSFFSLGSHFVYSIPKTRSAIGISRKDLVFSGVLTPLLWTCPLILAGAASLSGVPVGVAPFAIAMALSIAGAGILLQKSGTISGRKLALAE
jgi:O-antigen/teichoic acid export membrane protein